MNKRAVKFQLPDNEEKPLPSSEKVDILVVDDLPEKLLTYEAMLEELGQNLVTVRSGEDALKLVLRQEFAVILLDVNMPGMDGFETASLIRQRKKSAHIPIIFLTAFNDELRMAQGYASGAVDYLPTPVVPEILRAKVRVFIELSQMRKQAALQAEERAMRKAAEESARRAKFLVTASEALSRAQDTLEIMRTLVQLPIHFLADVSVLWQNESTQHRNWLGWAFSTGMNVQTAMIPEGLAAFPTLETAMREVATTGQPRYLPRLPASALSPSSAVIASPKMRYPTSSSTCTAMIVPSTSRGQFTGALLLARWNPENPYRPSDLSLATDLVSRTGAALENAMLLERIREADRRKNEFLAMLAHELRNPLAPIRNALHVMKMTPQPELRHEAEDTVERQLKHMVHLVDDLMDVSRITQGKIELRKELFQLREALEHAIETSQPLIRSRGHKLVVHVPEKPIWLEADFARISQIFSNLINNSAKYTDQGGQIVVSAQQLDDAAVISVRDNGIGIPVDMLPRIFDMFLQVDSSLERAQGGLGIGLTLVKKLLDMHGGSISALSNGTRTGSEFIVQLPVAEAPVQDKEAPADILQASTQPGTSLRVLIVDDNEASAKTLGWMMELLGHEAQISHDGQEAIGMARSSPPDIVLLDIGLPGMNGYEICKLLRQEPGLENTTFIAQTGWGQSEHRQRSQEAGFHHHLVKPIDLATLQDLMSKHNSLSTVA